jgi:hypothetical protein
MVLVTDLIAGLFFNSNRGSLARFVHAGAAFASPRSGCAAAAMAGVMIGTQRHKIAPRRFMKSLPDLLVIFRNS